MIRLPYFQYEDDLKSGNFRARTYYLYSYSV